nr:hypothetical protein CFP56_33484 [Quercus suber]
MSFDKRITSIITGEHLLQDSNPFDIRSFFASSLTWKSSVYKPLFHLIFGVNVMALNSSSRMEKPTIIGLYGLPGSGKTFTKDQLQKLDVDDDFLFYDGSAMIDLVVPGGRAAFKASTDLEKEKYRNDAMAQIQQECTESGKSALVTGHCMFWSEAAAIGEWVVTDKDLDTYTHIIYLDVSSEIILQRCQQDHRPRAQASLIHLRKWQSAKKDRLRKECYEHGILLSILTPSEHSESQPLLVEHILTMMKDFSSYSVQNNQLHAERVLDNTVDLDKLETMLV